MTARAILTLLAVSSLTPLFSFPLGASETRDVDPASAIAAPATSAPNAALAPSRPQASDPTALADTPSVAVAADKTYQAAAAPTPTQGMDMILGKYVSAPDPDTGLARFNYGALNANAADKAALKDYIASLEAMDPTVMPDDEAIAYWANLYNAVTIGLIIDNYPVKSIRKIKSGVFSMGPWGKEIITVNGEKMSLDDVEHETLRKQYPSPLIHYMVNCASVGCPNLKDSLWSADTLDSDREAAAKAYINSPRGVRITKNGLVVSTIYKWFKEDFGGDDAGVLAHLREYANEDLAAAIDGGAKISGYDYDWSLNE